MKVIPIEQVPGNGWNKLVDDSPDGWIFHRSDWVAIESRFFVRSNLSFAVLSDEGHLIALCPLYLRELGRGRWVERVLDSGHHRHAGPAFLVDLGDATRKAAEKCLMRHILTVAEQLNVDRVLLNANNLAPRWVSCEHANVPFWMLGYGFRFGMNIGPNGDLALPGMATLCADQILLLSQPENKLFDSLDPNFRKAVRKAKANQLAFQVPADDATDEVVERYYALAQRSAERTGESLAPKDYYHAILSAFRSDRRCEVVFARHHDTDAAALFLLVEKGAAHYLGGASDTEYLPLRVNNFIHWEAMRWLQSRSLSRYRLGPVFPELPPEWPISRVSRFKGEFGAQSCQIVQGSMFRKPEQYLQDARDFVPQSCALPTGTNGTKNEQGSHLRRMMERVRTAVVGGSKR